MPFDFATVDITTKILLRAREIVAERWCQHALGRPGGPRCAAGAVQEAADESPQSGDRLNQRRALRFLRAALPQGEMIPQYNDREGQTQAGIVALFDRAIELRMRGGEDAV